MKLSCVQVYYSSVCIYQFHFTGHNQGRTIFSAYDSRGQFPKKSPRGSDCKISHPEYFFLNIFLTLVGFSIYKAYFLSNNWTNHNDIFHIFKSEFELIRRYYESKQKNITFLNTLTRFIYVHVKNIFVLWTRFNWTKLNNRCVCVCVNNICYMYVLCYQ